MSSTLNFPPHGLLNIDKPSAMSSRLVVTKLEGVLAPLAVGHAGTLDPLATGVLVVCVGRATKLVDYLHRFPKTYVATFLLGQASDTEDITGEVEVIANSRRPSRAELEAALPQFTGSLMQQPPAFSALKVDGRRAYKMARKGKTVALQPRPIIVHRFHILRYEYPQLEVEIECGTGTYIRSLGRDLARAVGTEALMSQLRRTAIGPFAIDAAISFEQVRGDNVESLLRPSLLAVDQMPQIVLDDEQMMALQQTGVLFGLPQYPHPELAALTPTGRLFAVLVSSKTDRWKVKTLLR
ncbi:tRNA pseudouridine synthase B [Anatilimnocola aggregata]|uniref:tRNA pseudouridine synthase B n=1 Tax=Anatilimnocola aggregata TaxID=2528021 RepID=A0A517Y6A6_9BACT|nr:tRNA pseudouridine(55) synthase TruB [Anatilimnocola aggregata]QDU25662.1 tRNA pseudouridine synthase B [Anatilimnocola aggregata]